MVDSMRDMNTCKVCHTPSLQSAFTIHLSDGPFGNNRIASKRTLLKCESCGHLIADQYDQLKYENYYAALATDYHISHDSDRSRYDHILGMLANKPFKRVLDVGCGTGTFLSMLPADVERFGIEPSAAAARCARSKNVRIITPEELVSGKFKNSFDVVTAIDVVEHAWDLTDLRKQLLLALRPGGTLILLTGNSESRTARALGRYWYYLSFAEHVSVFSSRSVQAWLKRDFARIEIFETHHHRPNLYDKMNILRMWLFFPAKYLIRALFPGYFKMYTTLALGKDHMLVSATRT